MKTLRAKYPAIAMADLLQVASSVAIVTCPCGPGVTTYVGRVDSSVGNPNGRLTDVHDPAADHYSLIQANGFNAVDLAALLRAHSTSKTLAESDIPASTP